MVINQVEIHCLQQLLIKSTMIRVAGRSPAKGFILLFVVGLQANCCKTFSHENGVIAAIVNQDDWIELTKSNYEQLVYFTTC